MEIPTDNIHRRKRTPSIRQIKALQLIREGYSPHKALKEAGYSNQVQKNPKEFFSFKTVQALMADMYKELLNAGVTHKYIAQKVKEQLDATKIHSSHTEPDREVPDNQARLKAIDTWHSLIQDLDKEPGRGVTRKLTIEEFINEPQVQEQEIV